MPLPPKTSACWMRLAMTGSTKLETKVLGLQLLFKRFGLESTPSAERISALYTFFEKYEKILASEINQLTKL